MLTSVNLRAYKGQRAHCHAQLGTLFRWTDITPTKQICGTIVLSTILASQGIFHMIHLTTMFPCSKMELFAVPNLTYYKGKPEFALLSRTDKMCRAHCHVQLITPYR